MSQTGLDEPDERSEPGATRRYKAGVAEFPDDPAAEAQGGVVFVTPDGSWVREGSSEFLGVFGDPDPDYDAASFAIKNFGFVAVSISPQSPVDIKLHPRNLTAAAVLSLQKMLAPIKSDWFRITYLKEAWTSEVEPSAAAAICRLSEICALDGAGNTRPAFLTHIH